MASSGMEDSPQVVSDGLLQKVAGELGGEWLELRTYLNISEGGLHSIRQDHIGNTREAKYQMLLCWKKANGQGANHITLAEALLKAKRKDLSEIVQADIHPTASIKEADNLSNQRSGKNEPCEHTASFSKGPRTTEELSVNRSAPGDGDMTADMKSYGQFRLELESLLTLSNAEALATLLNYPRANIGRISSSPNPSRDFVTLMDERGDISPNDISTLIKALENTSVGLGGVARRVNEVFRQHVRPSPPTPPIVPPTPPIVPPTPPIVPPTEPNEKKTLFLTQLKKKYKKMCGGIQPAPFLRNKYDIDKLFVGSGIKFLAEDQKGGKEQETWIGLGDYKKIFTEPQIKSKRRIIDGEPGYGKSTLALQMTHDWCQEKAPMNKFEILILLRLRQYKKVPDVYSAIKKFLLPKDSELTEVDIKDILDSSSTVILLDGYDEYPDRGKRTTDIELIIREEMFQKHEVVLTTRTSYLPPDDIIDIKRIRLTGFDKTARDTYIRNVVAGGSTEDADKINHFLETNPVPADLCKSPLFFAMISYMVHNHEKFHNLTTVTHFFRHIIKCFLSHDEVKEEDGERIEELDHSKLDEIAFEGLSGDAQQISWDKNKLRDQIGNNLYDKYVRIGILIEEESYDYDSIGYRTETRFFHKLFAEWYAGHYLAKLAAQPEATFEPWHEDPRREAADTSQRHQTANTDKVHSLKSLNPDDLHYMYRYACGLDSGAALKIIKHLAKNRSYDKYTLLCIPEWSGSLETMMEIVTLLCKRTIRFKDTDSLLLQKSTVALVKFASTRKIPMKGVWLYDCLDVGDNGILSIKPSNLHLPVIDTLSELRIYEDGPVITEKETDSILQYSAKCLGLKKLVFDDCLLPRYIKVTESMSVLRQRDVKVWWWVTGIGIYDLNLESGQWETRWGRKPMTDEQYQKAKKKVRKIAEEMKQELGKD